MPKMNVSEKYGQFRISSRTTGAQTAPDIQTNHHYCKVRRGIYCDLKNAGPLPNNGWSRLDLD